MFYSLASEGDLLWVPNFGGVERFNAPLCVGEDLPVPIHPPWSPLSCVGGLGLGLEGGGGLFGFPLDGLVGGGLDGLNGCTGPEAVLDNCGCVDTGCGGATLVGGPPIGGSFDCGIGRPAGEGALPIPLPLPLPETFGGPPSTCELWSDWVLFGGDGLFTFLGDSICAFGGFAILTLWDFEVCNGLGCACFALTGTNETLFDIFCFAGFVTSNGLTSSFCTTVNWLE